MYTCFRTDYFIILLFPYFLASKCVLHSHAARLPG